MIEYYLKTNVLFFMIGAILLSLFTIWVYRSGAVHQSRHTDGSMNTQSTWQGKALSVLFLAMVLGVIFAFDVKLNRILNLNFWQTCLANFILLFLLTFFDSFFIDLFVLARWKPSFLQVPEEVSIDSMRFHVKKTFQLGWIILLIVSLLSAFFYILAY